MPTRGSPQAAGFDLSSAVKTVVPAGGRAIVKTDLSIACPAGTYARIAPRRQVNLVCMRRFDLHPSFYMHFHNCTSNIT